MEVFQAGLGRTVAVWAAIALCGMTVQAQREQHGRKYQEPPPVAHIVVTVEKGFATGKPLPNAAVIFRAVREGHDDGNLEIKTNPEGQAIIDVIEVGSHLTVQVIASGFAPYATDFDVETDKKELLVKMQRPRAQVSAYEDNSDKAADVKPGVQEPAKPKAPAAAPPAATPKATDPAQKAPPAGLPQ